MGFDICIGGDESYLSYNWSNLSNWWYINNDLYGKTGHEATKRLKAALQKLRDAGFDTGIPDPQNSNWSYGTQPAAEGGVDAFGHPRMERMPEKKRMGVFIYHLERLLKLAKKHPDDTFSGDSTSTTDDEFTHQYSDLDTDDDDEKSDSASDEGEFEGNGFSIPYIHPAYGHTSAKTFKGGMELYALYKSNGDKRAEEAYAMAFLMKGAPAPTEKVINKLRKLNLIAS